MQQTNILEYFDETIKKYPDKTAFANEDFEMTFSEVYKQSRGIGTFLFFRVISEISKTLKTYNMEGIVKVSNNSDNNQNNSRNTVENDIHIIEGKDNYFSIGDTAIEISTGKRVIITNINKDGTYQCETENGENIGNLKQIELAQLN